MSTEDIAKPIIVCVDDDPEILASVSRCLRRDRTLDVRTTLEPDEALAWIAEHPVAVLVSDYEMPQMTGAQLAGKAKRTRAETVRILLTGRRSLDTAIDGINQGEIFKFISKPFDNDDLRHQVDAAIARNRELLELAGDRQRRQRGERLRGELEAEFPGITKDSRPPGGFHDVPADPRAEAAALGLAALMATED